MPSPLACRLHLNGLQNGTYLLLAYCNISLAIYVAVLLYNTVYSRNYVHTYPPVPVPGHPSVNVTSITSTSISLSWSVPSGSVVDSYEVMWQRDTSVGYSDEDEASGIINTNSISTSYVISGLEEDSLYRTTVTAVNSIANVVSETVTAMTKEAGEKYC